MNIKKGKLKFNQILFVLTPLLLFSPVQYSTDLRNNYLLYIICGFGLFLLPRFLLSFSKNFQDSMSFKILVSYFIFNALIIPFSINIPVSLSYYFMNLSFFVLYGSLGQIVNDYVIKLYLLILLASTAILGLMSLYNTLILNKIVTSVDGASFMWVYFGHNHLSAVLVLTLPILLFMIKSYWTNKQLRLVFSLLFAYFILLLLFSFARASIITFSLIVAYIIGNSKAIFEKKSYRFLIILAIGLIMILLVNFEYKNLYQQNKSFWGTTARLKEMKKGLINSLEYPITGTGWGTYRFTREGKPRFSTDFTHNFVIDALSDTGLISTSLLIGFLTLILSQSFKAIPKLPENQNKLIRWGILAGVAGLLINNMVDFDLQLPSIGLLFWIFLGLLNIENQTHANQLEKNSRS